MNKRKIARPDVWRRDPKEMSYSLDGIQNTKEYGWVQRDDFKIMEKHDSKERRFLTIYQNEYLDVYTNRAVLKASAAVVSIVSYCDEREIFHGSGIVIESDGRSGIILTSASLNGCSTNKNAVEDNVKVVVYLSDGKLYEGQILAYDFHYNLAAIKIQLNAPLTTARLRHLNDCITIDPNELGIREEKTIQLCPHSSSFDLIPGDTVIALGRYFIEPYEIMAAPGEFSANRCDYYDCQELFRAECRITRCGSGGPLINCFGEVIGVTFYDDLFTPFMPINVACKWWEHCKKNEEPRRLWHGMEVANLYVTYLHILEKIAQKFPNLFKGVLVEEVLTRQLQQSNRLGMVSDFARLIYRDGVGCLFAHLLLGTLQIRFRQKINGLFCPGMYVNYVLRAVAYLNLINEAFLLFWFIVFFFTVSTVHDIDGNICVPLNLFLIGPGQPIAIYNCKEIRTRRGGGGAST